MSVNLVQPLSFLYKLNLIWNNGLIWPQQKHENQNAILWLSTNY